MVCFSQPCFPFLLIQFKGRFKQEKDVPSILKDFTELLENKERLKAQFAFGIQDSEDLLELLNLSQSRALPLAPIFLQKLGHFEATLNDRLDICFSPALNPLCNRTTTGAMHPRVQSALSQVTPTVAEALVKRFKKCRQSMQEEFGKQKMEKKEVLDFLGRLMVLDPRNVATMNPTWESYADLFGPEIGVVNRFSTILPITRITSQRPMTMTTSRPPKRRY